MKVSEIKYVRPDVAKLIVDTNVLIDKFEASSSVEEMLSINKQMEENSEEATTMGSLAYIRFTLNTKDEFYLKEKDYYDEILPSFDLVGNRFSKVILAHPQKDAYLSHFPKVVGVNLEIRAKAMSEEIVSDMIEENKLVSEYTLLMSNVNIDYNGETLPLASLSKYDSNSDRTLRKGAYLAMGGKLKDIADQLDEIFDQLIKVRTRMANKLGLKTYTQLGSYQMNRNCYTREDIAKFRENVKKHIVPLVSELKGKVAERLKFNNFASYDNSVYTLREPKPIGTVEEIFNNGAKMYKEMSEETNKLFNIMSNAEAFDVISRDGKWGGGYCSQLDKYKLPFILANFNGSSSDIDVLTHEFGHALAAYKAFDIEWNECRSASYETCEVHSMSMEFFAYKWIELFFGDLTEEYKFSHISSSATFIPYGTIIDYFQECCYENPNMTKKQRNELWSQLELEFRPYMSAKGIPFEEDGHTWQRKAHIFESPFYYIDYCLAQFTAFQFLSLLLVDYDSAFDKYMKFVNLGGTMSFTDLLKSAGLKSPFEEETFIDVVTAIRKLVVEK